MIISYFGLGNFKLQTKNDNGTTIIINPINEKSGLNVPNQNGDVVILSDPMDKSAKLVDGKPFIINSAGEYDIKEASVIGIAANNENKKGAIYRIKMDDLTITYLNTLNTGLNAEQMDGLNGTDILLIPIGGNSVLAPEKAIEIINALEPRIVIPMYYSIPGLTMELGVLDNFLKLFGVEAKKEEKLKISKKDLPQENTQVIVLGNFND